MSPHFRFDDLASDFGIRISDVDLADLSGEDLTNLLRVGLARHKLLVFEAQHLNHSDLVRVVTALGEPLHSFPVKFRVPGFPALTVVSNIFEGDFPIGLYDGDSEEEWHCDHSFCERIPSASLLYSVISAAVGGSTRFANNVAAFQELPSELRQRVERLRALHSLSHLDASQRGSLAEKVELDAVDARLEAWHDVVATSHLGGDKTLLLGKSVIRKVEEQSEGKPDDMVAHLEAFCIQPRFVYEHRWRNNDLVVWDNLALMHTASPCDSKANQRLLYRALAV